jgi:hypothetical protein
VALKFFPGQPQKIIAVVPDVFSAFTEQNFKDWGRGPGGGLFLRRNLKETPTGRLGYQIFQRTKVLQNIK